MQIDKTCREFGDNCWQFKLFRKTLGHNWTSSYFLNEFIFAYALGFSKLFGLTRDFSEFFRYTQKSLESRTSSEFFVFNRIFLCSFKILRASSKFLDKCKLLEFIWFLRNSMELIVFLWISSKLFLNSWNPGEFFGTSKFVGLPWTSSEFFALPCRYSEFFWILRTSSNPSNFRETLRTYSNFRD